MSEIETKHEREARLGEELVATAIDRPLTFAVIPTEDQVMHATDLIARLMHFIEAVSHGEQDDVGLVVERELDTARRNFGAEMKLHREGEPWDSGAL